MLYNSTHYWLDVQPVFAFLINDKYRENESLMNLQGAAMQESPPSLSQEKAIAGRKAILEAAELLFAQKGYQAASIDNIAVAARVSRGLVHYHFHSKEDLFMELVKNVMDSFSERLQTDLTNCSTARTKIRAMLLAFLNLAETRRNLWRTGVSEASGLSERIRKLFDSYHRSNLAIIVNVLEGGVSSGELKTDDSQFVAHCLMAIITSTALGKFLTQLGLKADTTAERISTLLLDGITP